uniref:60S ribosomal protein L5-2 n=1 Tax=Aegilops tauschii TaxID=37682 RepID=N1QS95_AEGTA
MASPRISCAPEPSPSQHSRSRSKDAEAVQLHSSIYFKLLGIPVARKSRKIRQRGFHNTDKSLLSRIAMGAMDGGLDLPHSDKRFAGFMKDKKQLGAEIHLKYIYEGHVADYMKLTESRFNFCPTLFQSIADEKPKKYQSHFRLQMPQGLPNKGSQRRNGLTKKGFALQVQNTFPLPIDDDLPV